MSVRPRGRPAGSQPLLSVTDILTAAFAILDSQGSDALTMRKLADRLNVSPMSIYRHFDNREALIKAMSEHAYAQVRAPDEGPPWIRLERLLLSYRTQILRHPGLSLLIFSTPAAFPEQAGRITWELGRLLEDIELSPPLVEAWTGILVDFIHGAALATALDPEMADTDNPAQDRADHDFHTCLSELLNCLKTRVRVT